MKKKILSLILAFVMSLSLMATAFAAYGDDYGPDSDTDNSDIIWNFTGADEDLNQLDEELPLTTSFKDVKSSAWYYSDVTECAKLGIVQGFSDGTFKPEDKVTAIQFLVMLTRTFYNAKVEAVKAPAGSTWYYANTKVATDVGMTNKLPAIDEKPMNRYCMAQTLYNTMSDFSKQPSAVNINAAKSQIKDWATIEASYKTFGTAVAGCYAKGIITGMSDGTFSGNSNMTRAQACTVIMRMLKLINNYNPGDKDNSQYDDGKSQNTGNTSNNNNTSTSGKLANGKPATVENVNTILADIKKQYPNGTPWNATGPKYAPGVPVNTTTAAQIMRGINPSLSCALGCGGWANMVSSTIFGLTGNPGRQVTKTTDLRPGDIFITMNTKTGTTSHVAIVTGTFKQPDGSYIVTTCDGNSDSEVAWDAWNTVSVEKGTAIAYTRYPQ